MQKIKELKYFNIFLFAFLFVVIALIFVFVGSVSTSPVLSMRFTDSSIFQTIGKGWANGYVPYAQLWDLKGPYIFFVDALGYVFTENSVGLFVIQIINFVFIEIAIFKIFRLKLNRIVSFLLLLNCLAYLFFNYDAGNTTEEFCLPFILFSVYFQLKWLFNLNNGSVHNPFHALFYGVTFTVCLMTRATNFIGVGVGVVCIFIYLMVKSNFKILLKNILMFLFGFIVTVSPFCLYFGVNNAFYDFLYGTFIYNMGYSKSLKFIIRPKNFSQACSLVGGWATSVYFIYRIFVSKNNKERIFCAFCLVCSLSMFLVILRCLDYKHYAILLLPYYCVALLDLSSIIKSKSCCKKIKNCGIVLLACFVILGCLGAPKSILNCVNKYKNYSSLSKNNLGDQLSEERLLFNEIPLQDQDSFMAYNCNSGIYLDFGVFPCYRFFVLQSFEILQNESLRPYVVDEFNKLDAKWILVNKSEGAPEIQDVLDTHYFLASQTCNYALYKLNEYLM